MSQTTYLGFYPNTRATAEFHSPESKILSLTKKHLQEHLEVFTELFNEAHSLYLV